MNRLSRLFQPLVVVPKNAVVKKNELTSKSQKVRNQINIPVSQSPHESNFIAYDGAWADPHSEQWNVLPSTRTAEIHREADSDCRRRNGENRWTEIDASHSHASRSVEPNWEAQRHWPWSDDLYRPAQPPANPESSKKIFVFRFTIIRNFLIPNPQTNEESITALMSMLSPVSYKQLPLRLYQVEWTDTVDCIIYIS